MVRRPLLLQRVCAGKSWALVSAAGLLRAAWLASQRRGWAWRPPALPPHSARYLPPFPTKSASVLWPCELMQVTMSEANFVLGGIEQADTVILGVPSDVPYPDCDACILSAMAQIQRLVAPTGRKVHVVAKVRSPSRPCCPNTGGTESWTVRASCASMTPWVCLLHRAYVNARCRVFAWPRSHHNVSNRSTSCRTSAKGAPEGVFLDRHCAEWLPLPPPSALLSVHRL